MKSINNIKAEYGLRRQNKAIIMYQLNHSSRINKKKKSKDSWYTSENIRLAMLGMPNRWQKQGDNWELTRSKPNILETSAIINSFNQHIVFSSHFKQRLRQRSNYSLEDIEEFLMELNMSKYPPGLGIDIGSIRLIQYPGKNGSFVMTTVINI